MPIGQFLQNSPDWWISACCSGRILADGFCGWLEISIALKMSSDGVLSACRQRWREEARYWVGELQSECMRSIVRGIAGTSLIAVLAASIALGQNPPILKAASEVSCVVTDE